MIDDRLSINLTHADGRITRLGPDETDAARIPQDLSFSTSIPGGFKDASLGLLRRIDTDHPDLDLFDNVRIIGPGGRVAWEGRQAQFPRSHGDSFQITPGAVGWNTHLRDDPSFREVYVDRNSGAWFEATLARRVTIASGGSPQGKIPVTIGQGGIVWAPPNEALPTGELTEIMYDAGPGLTCSRLGYRGTRAGAFTNFEAPTVFTAADETMSSTTSTALNLNGVANSDPVSNGDRFLMMRCRVSAATTPAVGHLQSLDQVVVYGGHGLTLRSVTGDQAGLYASDVIADVVSRAAPLLTYTTGTGGSIEPTSFVIPHLVYRDPVTAESAIFDVNKYHLYDWGVWENREFFYRQPDPDRLCWEARLGDGAHMDADGLTGEQVINGVFVTYTDPGGVQQMVGPPGGNFAGVEDDALADTSEANPANSHGIPAKWDNLTLSFPTTQAGAIQIGTVYLAERSLATRRGSLRLTGTVQHPTEGKVPVWRVRAGDWVRVTDLNGENATVQRKIISTSYSHASRQITCELDNTPSKISAILERVGVMTGIASGGGF